MDSEEFQASIDYEEQVSTSIIQEFGQPAIPTPVTLVAHADSQSGVACQASADFITDAEFAAYCDDADEDSRTGLTASVRNSDCRQPENREAALGAVTHHMICTPTVDAVQLARPAQEHSYNIDADIDFGSGSSTAVCPADSHHMSANEGGASVLSQQQHDNSSGSRQLTMTGSLGRCSSSIRSSYTSYSPAMPDTGTAVGTKEFAVASAHPGGGTQSHSISGLQRASTGDNKYWKQETSTQDGRQQLYRSSSLEAQQQSQQRHQDVGLEILHISQWQVHDVCDWVECLGLPQYRKKLLHHCIDGQLLTQLTDQQLKGDIGIGPLGHRYMLLQAVEAVQSVDLVAAASGMIHPDCSPAAVTAISAAVQVAAAAMHRLISRPWSSAGGARQCGQLSNSGVTAACISNEGCGASRCRPSSAPCWGRSQTQSPQASNPGALGPAAGRTSVFEQRAKLLFELSRAQARAAAQCSTAAQVEQVARLAAAEVARLKGQLSDLDRKNKHQVAHCSGSVDIKGQIPWQHVGAGTRAADPHPESLAKPWDPPDADLTFSPKISKKSLQIMAETRGQGGAGGFLDRLENDLRRRQTKMKDLQRRYQGGASVSSPVGPAVAKTAAADLAAVADFINQRGWGNISVSNSQANGLAYQELDEQLGEMVDSYHKELNLSDAQAQAIMAARGAKKVAALAAAVRTCQFMDRYKVDLSTRCSRLQELQSKWFKQQMTISTSTTRPGTAAPLTPEQRDVASAVEWFQGLGWGDDAQDDDCDELLSALLKRARTFKTESEKLHDKAQAAAVPAASQQAAAGMKPDIDWQALPWSADGLNTRMQKLLDGHKAAAEVAAARAAASSRSAAVNRATPAAVASQTGAGSADGSTATSNGSVRSPLNHAVELLAGMRWAGLDKLDAAMGSAKKLAVYRALRTQSFLEFTAADLAAREAKQRAQWEAIEASRRGKLASKQELDEFYRRLQEDGERRKAQLETAKAVQAEREAKALASMKAANSARSSRHRPKSARA